MHSSRLLADLGPFAYASAQSDLIVLAHARALLDSSEAGATEYIEADLRDTVTVPAQAVGLLDSASR